MEETDDKVQERPATEKAKAQRILIVVVALVLCVFVVALVAQLKTGDNEVDDEAGIPAPADAPKAAKAFDDQVKIREKRLAREASLTEEADLNSRKSTPTPRHASGYIDGGIPKKEKTPDEEFKKRERMRSLQSSRSGFDVQLDGDLKKPVLTAPLSGSSREQKADIENRIAEARRLRKGLASGRVSAEDVAARLGTSVPTIKQAGPVASPAFGQNGSQPYNIVGFSSEQADANNEDVSGKLLISTGTVINAVLDQKVISDYPGGFKGRVTHDVYDPTHDYVLIPKGAQIVGRSLTVGNINEPIQARMGLVVNWIIMPDGSRIDMTKTSALDHEGVGAMKDKVNRHFVAQFLGVAAYALLISEADGDSSSSFSGVTDVEGDVEEELRRQFAPLAAKYLNLVPTITLRSGMSFKVFIEDDVWVQPWSSVYENLLTHL